MTGKRQHFLPQFLLKGFYSRIKGKEVHVYVFNKGKNPFEVNTKKIAVENCFNECDDMNADIEITKKEPGFAQLIENIKGRKRVDFDSTEGVVRFVSHLAARTKHVRRSIDTSSRYLAERVEDNVGRTDFIDRMVDEYLEKNNIKIQGIRRAKLLQLKRAICKQIKDQVPEFFSAMQRKISSEIERGQIEVMASEPEFSARIEKYKKLHWYVKEYKDTKLILGDMGPVGVGDDGQFVPSFFDDVSKYVFLPISSSLLLIGETDDSFINIGANDLNVAISSLCVDFFVAAEKSELTMRYFSGIGVKSNLLHKEQIDSAVKNKFNK
jgi:hypothetical protein